MNLEIFFSRFRNFLPEIFFEILEIPSIIYFKVLFLIRIFLFKKIFCRNYKNRIVSEKHKSFQRKRL